MSTADVALLRAAFEEAADGDAAVFFRYTDEDVRVYPRPSEPDAAREYQGLDGLMEYLTNWYSHWEEYDFELVELHDAGDQVLAVLREHGRSPTGVTLEERFSHSFRVRDGKIAEWHMYDSHADALAALGLAG